MKWYDISNIEATGCDYNFIVSGRGPGKSTAMVNKLIDDYFNDESEFGRPAQFVRLERFDFEISKAKLTGWFNEVNQRKLEDEHGCWVTFEGMEWRLRPLVNGRRDKDAAYEVMGYVLPLNAQDEFKSGYDYSNVTNIVFEEFVQLRERDYVQQEPELFLSALSTIVRNRQKVRCWFIGNTLTKYNPYFDIFGIDIDRIGLEPGDLKTFRVPGYRGMGATIAIEYANMAQEDIAELSPLMRIAGNDTATSGLYVIDPSVSEAPSRIAQVPLDGWERPLPVDGLYLGDGDFSRVRLSKRPVYDGMQLLAFDNFKPEGDDLLHEKWLNLSDTANPHYTWLDVDFVLKCVAPELLWADTSLMHRLQSADARCAHAYMTDKAKYLWRNFVDMYGYERGRR